MTSEKGRQAARVSAGTEDQSGEGEDDGEGDDFPSFPSVHALFSAWCVADQGSGLFAEPLDGGLVGAAEDSADLWLVILGWKSLAWTFE
ncbi:hypothetical protein SUGI_0696240 [Cryptomeria japonica]|nr:hypothetical protein SUGI_0696240 [Cryptomeria japonica]